jgi:hypothetical protein
VAAGAHLRSVRIGNPEWAKTPSLIDASGLYAQFELGAALFQSAS